MNPSLNPFSPGAGSRPPELAGREAIIANARVALHRVKRCRSAQSQIFLGLRGTGKTVLLNEVLNLAIDEGYITSFVETPEDRPLSEILYHQIKQVLRKLSAFERAKFTARTALRALRSFASVFKISYGDFELGIEADPGVADSGDLEFDLADLFEAVGIAAKSAEQGWVLLIDEVQYLRDNELAALIVAVHRMSQRNLPVMVFAGGLPQIAKLTGDAKSYSERLFLYPEIGALNEEAAKNAILKPLKGAGIDIDPEALDMIVEKTQGYPFFLQAWGHHAWITAKKGPISLADVRQASEQAIASLDHGFFRVRFDRLSKAEIEYVRAMALLGNGPYKGNDVASALRKDPKSLGPRRASIIKKGMIYSPSYGDIDFTVPLFADFLRRNQSG